jgi:ribosomal protein S27AE
MSRTRSTDGKQCPKCGASLEYGALIDTVTGKRGWACGECNVVYSSLEV